jgi:hypothetical protein
MRWRASKSVHAEHSPLARGVTKSKETTMEYVFFWLAFAIIVGIAAKKRNRSGVGWFFLAVLISPLLAGLALVAVGRGTTTLYAMRKCPACAEYVQREARICKHCRSELPPMPPREDQWLIDHHAAIERAASR